MKFNDEVCTRTTINFSFSDKIRILLGRKVTVCVDVKTENVVGEVETESHAVVYKFLKSKHETAERAVITPMFSRALTESN